MLFSANFIFVDYSSLIFGMFCIFVAHGLVSHQMSKSDIDQPMTHGVWNASFYSPTGPNLGSLGLKIMLYSAKFILPAIIISLPLPLLRVSGGGQRRHVPGARRHLIGLGSEL